MDSDNEYFSDNEEDIYCPNFICLFCDDSFVSFESATAHLFTSHKFDFGCILKSQITYLEYVKIINYLRFSKKLDSIDELLLSQSLWDKDQFYIPVLQDDSFLQIDFDEHRKSYFDSFECVSISKAELEDLRCELSTAKDELKMAKEQILQMQDEARSLFGLHARQDVLNGGSGDMASQDVPELENSINDLNCHESRASTEPNHSLLPCGIDSGYFSSYGHFAIHETMLQDRVRTDAYRDFIVENAHVFEDKTVLDVGCGTGILSLFAATTGRARHVYGVDMSEIVYSAIDIVRENKLEDRITLSKGRVEDARLASGRVDVIISEWMGYFLLYESMLDTVLFARDNLLNSGGVVYPDRHTISLCATNNQSLHTEHVDYWSDVYGFKMSAIRRDAVKEAAVWALDAVDICTSSAVVKQ